jgi:hypothetical protein
MNKLTFIRVCNPITAHLFFNYSIKGINITIRITLLSQKVTILIEGQFQHPLKGQMGQWAYVTKQTHGHYRSVIIEDRISIILFPPYIFGSEVKFCRDFIQLSTELITNYSSPRHSISDTQSAKILTTG